MKLSKKDRQQLNGVLYNLKMAQAFLRKPQNVVCTTLLPGPLSFYDKNGQAITPIITELGCDLSRLHTAVYTLETLLLEEKA